MDAQTAYAQYDHLDELLSDRTWLPDGLMGQIMFDLWQAVKTARAVPDQTALMLYALEQGWRIQPTACTCGGLFAWLRQRPSGALEMVGCVCHTDLREKLWWIDEERKP